MSRLFLFGTLCYVPLLNLVLGHESAPKPATLPGYRAVWAKGQSFPFLVEDASATASGIYLDGLSAADLDRLNFYEAAFEYDLIEKDITVAGQSGRAQVYFPVETPWEEGSDWDLDLWVERFGAITLEAAGEVMRAYGVRSAAEVSAVFPAIRARAQALLKGTTRQRPVTVSTDFTSRDVEVTSDSIAYEKFFRVSDLTARFRKFDGSWGETGNMAVFHAFEAVTVLPYDPIRDEVLLVEQLRIGVYVQGDPQPWLLEPVAGIIDMGETVEDAAHREAREEAGIGLKSLHKVAGYYPTPGAVAQYLISYIGIADLSGKHGAIGGLDDEGENIRSHVVSFDHLMTMLDSGEMANAPLIMSVQWLAMHRAALQRQFA